MKIGLRAMALMLFMAFALSCTKTEDPVVQDNSLNGHEYVDLGLPSGLLWATCNVGLGIYWSSTLHSGFPERGWSLHFDDVNYHVCGTYERCRGQVVRAVCCRQ